MTRWRLKAIAVIVAMASFAVSPGIAIGAEPTVEDESVSHVTATNAVVEAVINPGDLETEYQFRVIGAPCMAIPLTCEVPSDPLFPSTPGVIPASSSGQPVAVNLSDAGLILEPGATYHYAVIATNNDGTKSGPDQTFTTPNAPVIANESATSITHNNATLNAEIDPNGEETVYRFQIDTTGHFKFDQQDGCVLHPPSAVCAQEVIAGEPLPAGLVEPPEQSLPAGDGFQKVSVDLGSIGATLQPATTYYYRVIAAHDAGEIIEGPTQTFTTSVFVPTPPVLPPPTTCGAGVGCLPPHSKCGKGKRLSHGKCVKRRRRCGYKHRRHRHLLPMASQQGTPKSRPCRHRHPLT